MPYSQWKYSQLRHEEMLKQAQAARLERLITGKQSNHLYRSVLVTLGGMMVAFGRKLHQRYAPTPRRTYLTPNAIPAPQPVNHSMAEWYGNSKSCEQETSSQMRNQGRFFKASSARGHSGKRKKTNR